MGFLSAVSCGSYKISVSKANARERKGENPVEVKQKHLSCFKKIAPPLAAVLVAVSPICHPPQSLGQSLDIQRGTMLFHKACIGCHDAGGNLIQPGSTLFANDLQRNGVDTEEEIFRITYFGKGRMPGFGEKCTPRGQCTFGPRLQDEEIRVLASLVKLQADQGWPNLPNVVE